MIKSFLCKDTEKLFQDFHVIAFKSIERLARKKLYILNAAKIIEDLKSPPGNRLEKLTGDRLEQWSVRINKQWWICFKWQDGDCYQVEIVDYQCLAKYFNTTPEFWLTLQMDYDLRCSRRVLWPTIESRIRSYLPKSIKETRKRKISTKHSTAA